MKIVSFNEAVNVSNHTLRRIVVMLFMLTLLCANAPAEFVSGVETFDGTVKDLTTWEEHGSSGISQNDKLIFDATAFRSMDYTTKTVKVGVGEFVRVELSGHSNDGSWSSLFMTTNSEGSSANTRNDSHWIDLTYQYDLANHWYNFVAFTGGAGSGGGNEFAANSPLPTESDPYILQIERTSSTLATFSVFTKDMTLIDSITRAPISGTPDDLYIGIGTTTDDGLVIFDNVTIIPEPGTMSLLGLGALALLRKRKK